jgi:hypothetical protein
MIVSFAHGRISQLAVAQRRRGEKGLRGNRDRLPDSYFGFRISDFGFSTHPSVLPLFSFSPLPLYGGNGKMFIPEKEVP